MVIKIYALILVLLAPSQLAAGFTLTNFISNICIAAGLSLTGIGTAQTNTPAEKVMAATLTKAGHVLTGISKDLNNSNTFLSPVLNSINLLDPLHWSCIILGYYFVVKPTVRAGYNYLFPPKQKVEIHNHYYFFLKKPSQELYNRKNIKKMLEKPAVLGVSPI